MGTVQTFGTDQEPDPAKRLRKRWGARMRKTREMRGLTQAQVAELMTRHGVSVTVPAISQWENGATTPRYHHQIAWCLAMGRPHAEVFDMTEAA